jgi:hypothetical protein
MKKILLLLIIKVFFFTIESKAQLVSVTFEGNYVYIPQNPIDFKEPFLLKAGIENWFTKRVALGLNGQVGSAIFKDEESTIESGYVTLEKELEVSNTVFSLNLYTKIAIFSGDDYSISIKPEFGISSIESRPVIFFIDHVASAVNSTRYSTISNKYFCFGLGIQGQYFISDRWDICLNLGYNSYDLGKSLNRIDLKNEWSYGFNEKTNFLSAGIGFHYYLFGVDRR